MIKIGTDCSGIEAPIQALKKLKIPFRHEFASEIDKYARDSLLANYDPKTLYNDMTKSRNLPKLDMYVCGFPCQTFSMAGKRRGSGDIRGNVFMHCIKTIKQTKPSLFVLENVKGILSVENGEYWKRVQKYLNGLKEYKIYASLLNTRNYGIPQNRTRIYIVGIKISKQKYEFKFPKYVKMKSIKKYVDKKNTRRDSVSPSRKKAFSKFKGTFVDFKFINRGLPNPEYSPVICALSNMWCAPMNRKASVKELLSLQGFPKNFKQIVSDTQMKKQIGNSMSVNVLEHLFKECFKSLGWVK